MDQEQVKAAAARFIDALHKVEQGDAQAADSIASLFSEDAELTNVILDSDGGGFSGRDAIADFWREYRQTFGRIHSEFQDVTASDRAAGLFWHSSGTDAEGKPLEYDGVTLLNFDAQGRICRFKGYFDPRQLTVSRPAH